MISGSKQSLEKEEAILLARAKALSITEAVAAREDDMRHVVAFLIESRGYAIEVAWVREMLSIPKITPIPGVPAFIVGAINVRGNLVTLTDLEEFLGFGKTQEAHTFKNVLILESPNVQTGILVDEVTDCLNIPEISIEPPLVTLEERKLECLRGEIRLKGKVYALLDGKALLDNPRLLVE